MNDGCNSAFSLHQLESLLKGQFSLSGEKLRIRGYSASEYVCPGTCAQCPSVSHMQRSSLHSCKCTHKNQESAHNLSISESRLMGQRREPGTSAIGKEGKLNTREKTRGGWPQWRSLSGSSRVEDPKDKILDYMEAQGGPMHCKKRMAPWTQKKCKLVFHWGKTLAQSDSLGRLAVRQSQGITSCWHGYSQEGTSCCDTTRLKEPNPTVSMVACKLNPFCGAVYET